MRKMTITIIMGMTALAVLVLAGSVSADQTGAAPIPARDMSLGNLTPGFGSLASVQLVHGGHGGFHSRSGLFLGFGGYGPYYRGYPYGGYGSSSYTESNAPTCLWNGYKYTCYNSSGQIINE
jgi:hypothetical protein